MILKQPLPKTDICINELKDGQVAVITNWGSHAYEGRIVTRFGNSIISLNPNHSSTHWPDIIATDSNIEELRVRVLPKGTELIV